MGLVSAIGGIASAIIGKKSADKAREASLTGFRYLSNSPTVQNTIGVADAAGQGLKTALGLNPDQNVEDSIAYQRYIGGPDLTDVAFDDFRQSTGYDWRQSEGMRGITGSAAARGLLNSGATAKALTGFNQNLASQEYGNFVQQQRALGMDERNALTTYLAALQGQQQTGLSAAYNTASQGTSGGAGAAQYTMQGGREITSGLGMALGGISDMWQNRS